MKGFALLAQGGRRIPPCHPPRPSNPEATADFTGYWRLSDMKQECAKDGCLASLRDPERFLGSFRAPRGPRTPVAALGPGFWCSEQKIALGREIGEFGRGAKNNYAAASCVLLCCPC